MQVYGGSPPSGSGNQIAVDLTERALDGLSIGVETHDLDSAHPLLTEHVHHGMAADHVNTVLPYPGGQRTTRLSSHIHHRGHRRSSLGQVQRRLIGAVVVREHQRPRPGRYRISVRIRGDGRRQQDAGSVIIRKHERALDGTGGENNLFGSDSPEPFTGSRRGSGEQVGRHAFEDSEEIVVVVAEHGAARKEAHLLHRP